MPPRDVMYRPSLRAWRGRRGGATGMQHVHGGRSTRHGLLASLGENPCRVHVSADGGGLADKACRWRRQGLQVRPC